MVLREHIGLSTDLLLRTTWYMALKRRKMVDFQESPAPSSRMINPNQFTTNKGIRNPACMSKELLTKLRHKKINVQDVEAEAGVFG